MLFLRLICLALLVLVCGSLFSQGKTLQASKLSHTPPQIDGNLDDLAWKNAQVVAGFIQNFPSFGVPASQKTEVKIVYDNSAIYIGAYLYDDPTLIRKQITARDEEQLKDLDYFSVFLDTYNDDQNGFQFLVTSSNVQTDARLSPSVVTSLGEYGDKTWDAVWDSKVSIKNDGWVVEMRIPYISLRFSQKNAQDWGIQLMRSVRRNNETSFWNPVDPNINGFVNQFGLLKSLVDIKPPLRLSFSPYVSTGIRSTPENGGKRTEWLRNGGMDVKYGINESFTLDATLIPDFGQVVSDNVVNNLTPYEVQFEENRPFFTEGTDIFNKANLFYSRRVGNIPAGYNSVRNYVATNPGWEIVKNPSTTQLYNAAKFSGRNKKKFGIGIFNAVAAPMNAKIHNKSSGKDSTIRTSPLTNYNIIVLDQALKGRSYITFTNTNVMRRGGARDANVTALNIALYDKSNAYVVQATGRYSKIWGTNPSDGYNTSVKLGKVGGNWQYFVSGNVESKDYDPNDLGILPAANEVTYRANISYHQFKPTNSFITYTYTLDNRVQNLYKPYAFSRYDITGTGSWVFKNFWDLTLLTQVTPFAFRDYFYFELKTDGRRYLKYPLNMYADISGSTDSRKKWLINFGAIYARSPDFDNDLYGGKLGFRYRFSNKFTLDLQGDAHKEINNLGYAFVRETNGDPVVGFRDVKEYTTVLSGTYNFTPRLNLTLRARHYWNEVKYLGFYNVDTKGGLIDRPFINNWNDNFNIFNTDAFLTWDFRLGSRLIVGYKNWLGDDEYVPMAGKNSYLYNLGEVFDLRHGNEATVRFIYFLDYNQLRKKH